MEGALGLTDRLRALLEPLRSRMEQPRIAMEIDLDEALDIQLSGDIPVHAHLVRDLDVEVAHAIATRVHVEHLLEVPIDEEIVVPLDLVLEVPLDTAIRVRDTLRVKGEVAIDTVVTALGVAPIPIRATLPIEMDVPLDQYVHIEGRVAVPVRQDVRVRLQRTLKVPIVATMPATVKVEGSLPVRLDAEFDTSVAVDHTLPVRLKKRLRLSEANVRLTAWTPSTETD